MNEQMTGLTKRINKAEHDRMEKYYKQVSHLQDWKNKVIEKIEESHKLTDALSQHFILENQISSLNQISEVMFKVCEGK